MRGAYVKFERAPIVYCAMNHAVSVRRSCQR